MTRGLIALAVLIVMGLLKLPVERDLAALHRQEHFRGVRGHLQRAHGENVAVLVGIAGCHGVNAAVLVVDHDHLAAALGLADLVRRRNSEHRRILSDRLGRRDFVHRGFLLLFGGAGGAAAATGAGPVRSLSRGK